MFLPSIGGLTSPCRGPTVDQNHGRPAFMPWGYRGTSRSGGAMRRANRFIDGSEETKGRPTMRMLPLTARPAWKALEANHEKVRELHLRRLFADDATRGERMTSEAAGIYLDYSKNRVTDETLALLCRLAEESGLRERSDARFRGGKINLTENRAVLHVALRAPRGTAVLVDGNDLVPEVHAVAGAMADFANRVR